jgi:hypothetical protein
LSTLELARCERHDMITAIWDIAMFEVIGSERVFMEINRILLSWYERNLSWICTSL